MACSKWVLLLCFCTSWVAMCPMTQLGISSRINAQWSLCAGYGGERAPCGLAVLALVNVFHAEFPGVLHAWSTPVALFGLTQKFSTASTPSALNWRWRLWSGYGGERAPCGLAVLEVVRVFHAEFPSVWQAWSSPVALFALVQMFYAGSTCFKCLIETALVAAKRRAIMDAYFIYVCIN